MSEWVVGVDLGGTKTALGLISPDNRIIAQRRLPTNAEQGPEAVVETIAQAVADLEKETPDGKKIRALGICAPGPLDHVTGTLINPTNLPKFYNTPLRQMLADRLAIPVSLEHDAKASALGEFHFGAGRGQSSMVFIVVGTGVGAAIIYEGQLLRGVRNSAGEVGHITLDPDGEACFCGSRGCVETFMSGPWLERRYRRTAGEAHSDITGAQITQLAAQGEPLAKQIITQAGEALGIAVASLAMILDIELYIIGGSVVKAGDLFLEPARQTAPRYSFVSVGPRIRIVAGELGDDAPLLGCGWLARDLLRQTA